ALIDDLGLDDVVVMPVCLTTTRSTRGVRTRLTGVHPGTEALERGGRLLRGRLDRRVVVALERLLELRDRGLDLGLVGRGRALGELVGVVGQELLGLVHQLLALVAVLDGLAALAVLLGV